eukprot:580120-Hanusia_phi.AAC.3
MRRVSPSEGDVGEESRLGGQIRVKPFSRIQSEGGQRGERENEAEGRKKAKAGRQADVTEVRPLEEINVSS